MECRDSILSNEYYDVITDYALSQFAAERGVSCSINIENLYNIVYLNRRAISDPNEYLFNHRSMPKLYGLMQEPEPEAFSFDPNSLIVSGISQVQREPLSLTGRGCVIVIIDTGIDYTSPVFRNPDGSSRILAIWDQTVQTGTAPEGFFYGSEYSREDINRALQSENPYDLVPSRDENGHGSNLAAVAAGSILDNGMDYMGAAPEADIVVVKLKECKDYFREFYLIPGNVPAYQENDIMLGVLYGDKFAETFERPVVYCIGLGTNYGDHSGSSALSRYLDTVAVKRSRAVVVCGGNEGNAAHHYQGNLNSPSVAGSTRELVEVRVGPDSDGFLMEIWGNLPDIFTVSVRSPGGETIPTIRLGLQDIITYGFIYERTRVTIAGTLVEPASGEELITMRIQTPTAGIWTFAVEAARDIHNGRFNIWLPVKQFLNAEVTFLKPSPYITLTEPAMASDVISVSTYDGASRSFYIESGRGFTRTGEINPDFAAPGVNISVLRGRQTGSSLAAAVTAGAVAQFMQWAVVERNDELVESREIKNYFARGATRNADLTYPNREWGDNVIIVSSKSGTSKIKRFRLIRPNCKLL
ncbi:MAG: S8 family peptidase [Butyrivibrio sp.]|nr:S8 family peptidase [Acetatifactor muris]MCM1561365.1 S8 family peptidase [Butyrivibrio sp.]